MKLPSSITFNDVKNYSVSFDDLDELIAFLYEESEFWQGVTDELSAVNQRLTSPYDSMLGHLNQLKSQMLQWKSECKNWSEQDWQNQMRSYQNGHSPYWYLVQSRQWISRTHSFVGAWVSAIKHSAQAGAAFIQAIISNQALGNAFDALIGSVLAYEYIMQGNEVIASRKANEQKTFSTLHEQLAKQTESAISKTQQFEDGLEQWRNQLQSDVKTWQDEQVEAQNQALKEHSDSFDKHEKDWKDRIAELELTYEEKLKLSKPAEYWRKTAESSRNKGFFWAAILACVMFVAIMEYFNAFHVWMLGNKSAFELGSLQGITLFITTTSLVIFAVLTLSKLMLSAFHLQRDAEEREQLTYLYLSLINEQAIDEKSREIVLQSLFSRADTGLLKDGNPIMPIPVLKQ